MAGQLGFWSITDRLAEISAQGDPLETLAATVDFEMFRPVLEGARGRPPRWKGGRPRFDPVLKFRMLVLQSLHGLSLEQTEYLVRDRLSWMRFCQLGPEDRVPDSNTLGARLREGLIQPANTSRDVWADSTYRSAENESWLTDHGMTSRIHRKKPRGRPMPERTSRANAAKSALRSKVEHVFAHQKARMRLTIRTIGIARAEAAITLANIAYNMTRWRWLNGRAAPA